MRNQIYSLRLTYICYYIYIYVASLSSIQVKLTGIYNTLCNNLFLQIVIQAILFINSHVNNTIYYYLLIARKKVAHLGFHHISEEFFSRKKKKTMTKAGSEGCHADTGCCQACSSPAYTSHIMHSTNLLLTQSCKETSSVVAYA